MRGRTAIEPSKGMSRPCPSALHTVIISLATSIVISALAFKAAA